MKVNELRVGNWVTMFDENICVTPETIKDCDVSNKKPSPYEYNPIPLTPEILVRCGFKLFNNSYELGAIIIHYSGAGYLFAWNKCYSHEIKYLHQLQNLYFALTGEELNITL